MDMVDRHIDDVHRPQRVVLSVQRRLAAAAFDQQNLVQPRVAVRGQLPVVQHRPRRDGFAMHDVGQISRLAEEVVDVDGPVVAACSNCT